MDTHSRHTAQNPSNGSTLFQETPQYNYKDLISNEEVKSRIKLEICQYEVLLSTVKNELNSFFSEKKLFFIM